MECPYCKADVGGGEVGTVCSTCCAEHIVVNEWYGLSKFERQTEWKAFHSTAVRRISRVLYNAEKFNAEGEWVRVVIVEIKGAKKVQNGRTS